MYIEPDNDPDFNPHECYGAAVAISCAMNAFVLFIFALVIYLLAQ